MTIKTVEDLPLSKLNENIVSLIGYTIEHDLFIDNVTSGDSHSIPEQLNMNTDIGLQLAQSYPRSDLDTMSILHQLQH